jgi:hypothetical protein
MQHLKKCNSFQKKYLTFRKNFFAKPPKKRPVFHFLGKRVYKLLLILHNLEYLTKSYIVKISRCFPDIIIDFFAFFSAKTFIGNKNVESNTALKQKSPYFKAFSHFLSSKCHKNGE